ncbi:unnamed protein product [Alopecurus aequalis]
MPADISMWVLGCFDPMRSELVIPGRGSIRVDVDSFQRNFGLLNKGSRVKYEMDPDAIAFMNEEYGIDDGMAPSFKNWCVKIKAMNGRKRKLTVLIGDLCTDISRRLGTFVEDYAMLNEDAESDTHAQNMRNKRQKMETVDETDEDEDDDETLDDTESAEETNNKDEDQDNETTTGTHNNNTNSTTEDKMKTLSQVATRVELPATSLNRDATITAKGATGSVVKPGVSHAQTTAATRANCPPPAPKATGIRGEGYCDAPSFSLGFDSPVKKGKDIEPESSTRSAIKPVDLNATRFDDDDMWSPEMIKEACAVCDKVEMEKGYIKGNSPLQNVYHQTPTGAGVQAAPNGEASRSTTGQPVNDRPERRLVRQSACKRSPYVDYSLKSSFLCSAEVKQVYDTVVANGCRHTRGHAIDKTHVIVSYEKFFVTLQELANSMMPGACLKNTVVELGIESIMLRIDKKLKKVVMPLRVAIVIPVMENLVPEAKDPVNHYWLLVINIRDKRFELLDSMRSKADKKLDACAKKLIAIITLLWEDEYKDSDVKLDRYGYEDIIPPKQTNP